MKYITIRYTTNVTNSENYIPATNCTSEHFTNQVIFDNLMQNIRNPIRPFCPENQNSPTP